MSTVLSGGAIEHSSPPRDAAGGRPAQLARWMREPLLHFLLLGGVLFGLDHAVHGRIEDPHLIVLSIDVDNEAKQLFTAARGRPPNPAELTALRRVWLDNEVLYREGLALQVDKGDTAIRDRVIFKALSIIEANLQAPPVDDRVLRTWFEAHRAKYDEPGRYDFAEAVLAGDRSPAAVRAFVDALNAGTPGDAQAGLRVFKGRPRASLVQSYGSEFLAQLDDSPPGMWRALHSREGWRAVRPDAHTQPEPADFARLRGVVLQDWTDAVLAEQRTAEVRALGKKYTVRTEVAGS